VLLTVTVRLNLYKGLNEINYIFNFFFFINIGSIAVFGSRKENVINIWSIDQCKCVKTIKLAANSLIIHVIITNTKLKMKIIYICLQNKKYVYKIFYFNQE
jgi:hypothetical protein